MKKQTAIAVLFLLLCGVLSVVAIGAKLEGLKQEQAFLGGLARDVWDLKAQANESAQAEAWQSASIKSLDERVVGLTNRETNVHYFYEGDAYCVVSVEDDLTVLNCRPFN